MKKNLFNKILIGLGAPTLALAAGITTAACAQNKQIDLTFIGENCTFSSETKVTRKVTKGLKFKDIDKPTVTPNSGYKFKEWKNGSDVITDDTVINANATITAVCEPVEQVTLTFFGENCTFEDGKTVKLLKVEKGLKFGNIDKPIVKPNSGYSWEKIWKIDSEVITDDTVINEDKTITAVCTKEAKEHILDKNQTHEFEIKELNEGFVTLQFEFNEEPSDSVSADAWLISESSNIKIEKVELDFAQHKIYANVWYDSYQALFDDTVEFEIVFKDTEKIWAQAITKTFTFKYASHTSDLILDKEAYVLANQKEEAKASKTLYLLSSDSKLTTDNIALEVKTTTKNPKINIKNLECEIKVVTTEKGFSVIEVTLIYTSDEISYGKETNEIEYELTISNKEKTWSEKYTGLKLISGHYFVPESNLCVTTSTEAAFKFNFIEQLEKGTKVKFEIVNQWTSSEYCKGVALDQEEYTIQETTTGPLEVKMHFIEGLIGKNCTSSFSLKVTVTSSTGEEKYTGTLTKFQIVYKGNSIEIDQHHLSDSISVNRYQFYSFDHSWDIMFNGYEEEIKQDDIDVYLYEGNHDPYWSYKANIKSFTVDKENKKINVVCHFETIEDPVFGSSYTGRYTFVVKSKTTEWGRWTQQFQFTVTPYKN